MPARRLTLADPPAEDLDSLEPVCAHSSEWQPRPRARRLRRDSRSPIGHPESIVGPTQPTADRDKSKVPAPKGAHEMDSRLTELEAVVRDCALMLRGGIADRLAQLERTIDAETARLDNRLHDEARRRCHLLTELTRKVSAAVDQLRLEARSAKA